VLLLRQLCKKLFLFAFTENEDVYVALKSRNSKPFVADNRKYSSAPGSVIRLRQRVEPRACQTGSSLSTAAGTQLQASLSACQSDNRLISADANPAGQRRLLRYPAKLAYLSAAVDIEAAAAV